VLIAILCLLLQSSFSFDCFGDTTVNGFVVWFKVYFPDGSCLSTSPYDAYVICSRYALNLLWHILPVGSNYLLADIRKPAVTRGLMYSIYGLSDAVCRDFLVVHLA